MPLTLRVGCARKLGQPGYSSLGASCALDVELDAALIERDPEALRDQIRVAFAACRAAVAEELARQAGPEESAAPLRTPAPDRPDVVLADHGSTQNGMVTAAAPVRPTTASRPDRPASERQVKAIRAIARRHGADLGTILRQEFQVDRVEELSVAQASRLIDELKTDAIV
ncbi:phage protein GemA/Gp16 family protein [Tautonia marina]|uniref:phage protein GemA/Gp16 family protein n=1 Tax=Tautonia marina TaxID=2653855 RepID=UPI00126056FC|nr:phage protein GemA/Gp16 family protein [Tautonia marina]